MEIMDQNYRDPETGKNGKVICPCCGAAVSQGKFCPECGAPLSEVSQAAPAAPATEQKPAQMLGFVPVSDIKICVPGEVNQEETPQGPPPVSDSGLTLLGDFCKKTMATIGGDGYDEIVLYKNEADGSFQIHTYMKYAYMQKEVHHSFKARDGAYDALLRLAEKLHLDEYEGKNGFGLCGGMYICKYSKDGTLHRVTTDNLGTDGPAIIIQVGNLLGSFKAEEIFGS